MVIEVGAKFSPILLPVGNFIWQGKESRNIAFGMSSEKKGTHRLPVNSYVLRREVKM